MVRRFTVVPPDAGRASFGQPDAAVLADVHHCASEPVGGDLVGRWGRVDHRMEVDAVYANVGGLKRVERRRIAAIRSTSATLAIIQATKRPFHTLVGILNEPFRRAAGLRARKLDVPPALGHVHVDRALRAPHPVVLRQRCRCTGSEAFRVPAVGDVDLPFHAREVDAPAIAGPGRPLCRRGLLEDLPRHRNLHSPALVAIARAIERTLHIYADVQARDVPRVDRRTTVAIRLDQQQIPRRAECVDLELVVRVRVAVWIDEDLEVVVAKNNGVALGQRCPDVGLFHLGGYVEVLVVPEHLRACAETRPRTALAFDVDERRGPLGGSPGGFVELAVDGDPRRGARRDVMPRRERQRLEVGERTLRANGVERKHAQQSCRKRYAAPVHADDHATLPSFRFATFILHCALPADVAEKSATVVSSVVSVSWISPAAIRITWTAFETT